MILKRVLSIGVFCENETIDDVAGFFKEILGANVGPKACQEKGGFLSTTAWVGTKVPFCLFMNESLSDDTPMGKQIKRLAPNFGFLCFEVENIDEAITELREKGIKVSDKMERHEPGYEGMASCVIHPKNAFGRTIELMQLPKDKPAGIEYWWNSI